MNWEEGDAETLGEDYMRDFRALELRCDCEALQNVKDALVSYIQAEEGGDE